MNDNPATIESDREPDLLSLLVAVAESWKLLLLGPVVVGVVVAIILIQQPGRYESRALLRLDEQSGMLTAPNVLRPVIEKLKLQQQLSPHIDRAVDILAERMSVAVFDGALRDPTAKDKLPFLIEVALTDSSPVQAQRVLGEIIAEVFRQSVPRAGDREDIEAKLEGLRQAVAELTVYADRMAGKAAQLPPGTDAQDYARALAQLVGDVETKNSMILDLERKLKGFGPENIIQPPTLPDVTVPQKKLGALLLTMMGTGLILLVFVLGRDAYRRGIKDPATAAKLHRIARSFFISSRRT